MGLSNTEFGEGHLALGYCSARIAREVKPCLRAALGFHNAARYPTTIFINFLLNLSKSPTETLIILLQKIFEKGMILCPVFKCLSSTKFSRRNRRIRL